MGPPTGTAHPHLMSRPSLRWDRGHRVERVVASLAEREPRLLGIHPIQRLLRARARPAAIAAPTEHRTFLSQRENAFVEDERMHGAPQRLEPPLPLACGRAGNLERTPTIG